MLELATILVLIFHLLAVNVAAGAPIVCVWLEWRGDSVARKAAAYLGWLALVTLVVGGLLGAALGWLKWTPEYRDLWTGPLSYKLHWGGLELLFSLALATAYWLLARGRGGESRGWRTLRGAIALVSGTNLLYHFPPLFIVAGQLHATGGTSGEVLRGAAFRQLAAAGESPALAVHVALASVAVAGAMLLGLALKWQRRNEAPADVAAVAGWGGAWALVASLLQLPVGLWTLAVLPASDQSRLMGSDPLATALFLASMLAALWLLREFVSVVMGETTRPILLRAMAAMLVVVALMTAMQQAMRPQTSRPGGEATWPVKS